VGIQQLYRFFGPANRILEKQGPADYRFTETEKLDSSAMGFAFQGFWWNSLFDDDFSRFTPEKERFECPLNFTDPQTMRDDLVEVGTMFAQALQICWQFVIPEVLASNDSVRPHVRLFP
jgi:hypothetical protein